MHAGSRSRFAMHIKIKRVYLQPSEEDGRRILVDRLWPRGLTKEKAGVDVWLKDIAPTTELRKWFGHHPARWNEFQKRYHDEMKQNAGSISVLKRKAAPSRFFLVRKTKSTMRPWFFDPSLKIDSDTRTAHSNQVTRPEICPNLHQSSASPS